MYSFCNPLCTITTIKGQLVLYLKLYSSLGRMVRKIVQVFNTMVRIKCYISGIVLPTVRVFDQASFIPLQGSGLTGSNIDDLIRKQSL